MKFRLVAHVCCSCTEFGLKTKRPTVCRDRGSFRNLCGYLLFSIGRSYAQPTDRHVYTCTWPWCSCVPGCEWRETYWSLSIKNRRRMSRWPAFTGHPLFNCYRTLTAQVPALPAVPGGSKFTFGAWREPSSALKYASFRVKPDKLATMLLGNSPM